MISCASTCCRSCFIVYGGLVPGAPPTCCPRDSYDPQPSSALQLPQPLHFPIVVVGYFGATEGHTRWPAVSDGSCEAFFGVIVTGQTNTCSARLAAGLETLRARRVACGGSRDERLRGFSKQVHGRRLRQQGQYDNFEEARSGLLIFADRRTRISRS